MMAASSSMQASEAHDRCPHGAVCAPRQRHLLREGKSTRRARGSPPTTRFGYFRATWVSRRELPSPGWRESEGNGSELRAGQSRLPRDHQRLFPYTLGNPNITRSKGHRNAPLTRAERPPRAGRRRRASQVPTRAQKPCAGIRMPSPESDVAGEPAGGQRPSPARRGTPWCSRLARLGSRNSRLVRRDQATNERAVMDPASRARCLFDALLTWHQAQEKGIRPGPIHRAIQRFSTPEPARD